jgi:hypothetical protein
MTSFTFLTAFTTCQYLSSLLGHTLVFIHMDMRAHTRAHTCTRTHTYTQASCMLACTHTHFHTHTLSHTHTHTYIHAHTHTGARCCMVASSKTSVRSALKASERTLSTSSLPQTLQAVVSMCLTLPWYVFVWSHLCLCGFVRVSSYQELLSLTRCWSQKLWLTIACEQISNADVWQVMAQTALAVVM